MLSAWSGLLLGEPTTRIVSHIIGAPLLLVSIGRDSCFLLAYCILQMQTVSGDRLRRQSSAQIGHCEFE
jgi:hypothetical protein